MRTLPALSAAILLGAGVMPGAAGAAPSIATDLGCYTPEMLQHVSGSGFSPGGSVELTLTAADGRFTGTLTTTADAAGALALDARLPEFDGGQVTATLTATDATQATASTTMWLSPWDVTMARWSGRPPKAKPGRRSRIVAVGWVGTAGRTLYAHYFRRGQPARTVRIGALTGPCADLTGRTREFPFRRVRPGRYRVQFDTTRAYPNDDAWIAYSRVVVGRSGPFARSGLLGHPLVSPPPVGRWLVAPGHG